MKSTVLLLSLLIPSTDSFSIIQSFHSSPKSSTELQASSVVIALTREDGKNDKLMKELSGRLKDETVEIKELPCIAHADGPDFGLLESTLKDQVWDYVAVTSPEAARVLATAWTADVKNGQLPSIAVVGKATQSALEAAGIPVDFCPSKATAATLVSELPPKRGSGTTLLYPASAKAATTLQDGLTERGFEVTRLDTYDTVTASWIDEEKEIAGQVGIACFGSPSAVEGWLANTDQNKDVLAACIGETSAKACRKYEWPEERIFFPDKPGVPGWAEATEKALQTLQVAHQE